MILTLKISPLIIFYWLDKSGNQKIKLLEFCQFVDIDYRQILNHISVR